MISKVFTSPVSRFSGGLFAWILPLLLALFGHKMGGIKADLPGGGPGIHIANMTERTLGAQRLWHYVNERTWFFVLYAAVLVIVFGTLAGSRVPLIYRCLCWAFVALPGFWYFRETGYLAGKILGL